MAGPTFLAPQRATVAVPQGDSAVLGAVAFAAGLAVAGQRARPTALLGLGGEEAVEEAAEEAVEAPAAAVALPAGDWNIGKEGMSQAIPFLKRPPGLGPPGTMAGDIGFDPLQISDLVPLQWGIGISARRACRG